MTKKCSGCGAVMQFTDRHLEGYINESKYETASICERCFRIKNYGDYKNIAKTNDDFISILKSINGKDLVILVMDLFNLPEDVDIIKDNIKNDILLVLTKRDILPKVIYEDRLLKYVDKYELNIVDKIIVSSNKNYHFDELISKIKGYKTSNNIYVVGFTNAGKSTLINKIIYNYSNNKPSITTSMLPSTTLNSIEIKFDDELTFIDTPGLLSDGSIENIVNVDLLKKIVPNHEIKPITYQIKTESCIIVEDIFKLDLSNNNITMFMSNNLKIDRYYKTKEIPNLISKEIMVRKGEDLVINGLGFIKFTNNEKVIVSTLEGVKVYTRKSLV